MSISTVADLPRARATFFASLPFPGVVMAPESELPEAPRWFPGSRAAWQVAGPALTRGFAIYQHEQRERDTIVRALRELAQERAATPQRSSEVALTEDQRHALLVESQRFAWLERERAQADERIARARETIESIYAAHGCAGMRV